MAYPIGAGEKLGKTLPRGEAGPRRGESCLRGPLRDVSLWIAKEGMGNTNIQDHEPFSGGLHICVGAGPQDLSYGDFELDTQP
jgi:hypothetical protein